MRKKVLPMLLALCMLVALLPITTHAQDYTEWNDSANLPTSDGVYKLTTNVILETEFSKYPSVRGNVVLDLNGHTVTVAGYGQYAYFLYSGASLTIEDNLGGGKITNAGTGSMKTLIQVNGGSLTLAGGTLENGSANGYALFANSGSAVQISGGTVINNASGGHALQVNGDGTAVTMTDGVIENTAEGADAVYVNNGSFALGGGTVKTSATYSSKAAIYANNGAAAVTISGGNIESASMGVYAALTPVSVTGGTITSTGHPFQTRYTTIEPADGSEVIVNSDKELFYTFSGSNNSVHGGDFYVPGITKAYTSENPSTTTITAGVFETPPTDYVSGDEIVLGYTGENGNLYVVGTEDLINAAIDVMAEPGSQLEILKGDADLQIDKAGITVSNSGGGSVSVNGQEVTGQDPVVTHINVKKVERKEATCTTDGNIAYWYCEDCGKYFKDAQLTEEITQEETVLKTKGHTAVKVSAKAATAKEAGNIEYWYCSACDKYFKDAALTQEISQKDTILPATGSKDPGKDTGKTEEKAPAKTSSVPSTGDHANVSVLWIMLLAAALCGTGAFVGIRKNRRK